MYKMNQKDQVYMGGLFIFLIIIFIIFIIITALIIG